MRRCLCPLYMLYGCAEREKHLSQMSLSRDSITPMSKRQCRNANVVFKHMRHVMLCMVGASTMWIWVEKMEALRYLDSVRSIISNTLWKMYVYVCAIQLQYIEVFLLLLCVRWIWFQRCSIFSKSKSNEIESNELPFHLTPICGSITYISFSLYTKIVYLYVTV